VTEVKLYSIPGSHPAAAARAMLEYKVIPYRRVDLPPVVSRALMRAAGFPGNRVPALKIDGRKVQGSRNISRELDVLKADPPLFPTDPEQRAAVEEAERWGDEEFQQMARTITWWALKRHKSDQASFLVDAGPMARLGMPTRIAVATSGPILRIAIRLNDSTDDTVRSTLASIGPALDKVDRLIAEGVIGGDQPNAADFQIGASVALLRAFEDVRDAIDDRPAAELARRLYPWYRGQVRASFPPEWLEPLRERANTPQ
jgi:glutathione S-transferase